jgi:PLP dependent protein
MSIKENLSAIRAQIPEHVTLIAVSKTKPAADIMQAYELGQKDFGENYVQELIEKQEVLPKDIRWHFIGHLQSNKVKYIAPFVYLIHGVDSLKLLKEINKEALKNNRIIKCLLQLHIASEETKFGLDTTEAEELLRSNTLQEYKGIEMVGFMAMASNTDDVQQVRQEFKQVKKLADKFPNLSVLSFGMSNDFEIAIEEGSNHVRIGSSIFGERNYSK